MNFKFPDTILQKREAQRVCTEFRHWREQGKADVESGGVSPELQTVITTNQQLWQTADMDTFLDSFEEAIKQAPEFDLILPVYPHDSFLLELGGWFRREIAPNSLLRIHVRRSIGGGIVLRSKNRLFDLSLRPQIMAAKQKIPEVLRRV